MTDDLTTTKCVDPHILRIEEGHDYLLEENDRLPYILIENLGHGHTANVEKVRDEHSSRVFARKVFRICSSQDERRSIFDNEIKIIRQLTPNPHIIRVFATYVARREVGLVLHPVADQGDLECFLQDYRDVKTSRGEDYTTLVFSFACLANGLSFMHDQKIRHKDIKPSNILIHQRKVIYTDFGISLDHSAGIGATTTGRPNAMTRRYCAPEVSEWEPRNSKSDIFSLGCVFFEILAAILELPPLELAYHQEISRIRRLLTTYDFSSTTLELSAYSALQKCAANFVLEMTTQEPDLRPSAQSIFKALQLENSHSYCEQCRPPPPELLFRESTPEGQSLVSRSMAPVRHERNHRWLGFRGTSTAARRMVSVVRNLRPRPNTSPGRSHPQPALTTSPSDIIAAIRRPSSATDPPDTTPAIGRSSSTARTVSPNHLLGYVQIPRDPAESVESAPDDLLREPGTTTSEEHYPTHFQNPSILRDHGRLWEPGIVFSARSYGFQTTYGGPEHRPTELGVEPHSRYRQHYPSIGTYAILARLGRQPYGF